MKHFVATTILGAALALPLAAQAADYTVMAPAAPGGGWDQTARSMQEALTGEGVSGTCGSSTCPAPRHHRARAVRAGANGDPSRLIVAATSWWAPSSPTPRR